MVKITNKQGIGLSTEDGNNYNNIIICDAILQLIDKYLMSFFEREDL